MGTISNMAFSAGCTSLPSMAFMLHRVTQQSLRAMPRRMSSAPAGAWIESSKGLNELEEALEKGGGKVVVTGAHGKIQGVVSEADLKNATKGKLVLGSRGALRREDSVVGDLTPDD